MSQSKGKEMLHTFICLDTDLNLNPKYLSGSMVYQNTYSRSLLTCELVYHIY